MNDFSELENELRKLRPASLSEEFLGRVENALDSLAPQLVNPRGLARLRRSAPAGSVVDLANDDADAGNIIRPSRFKVSWLSLGLGLAAAAGFLIFARIGVERTPRQNQIAHNAPAPQTRSTTTSPGFIPAGATQVVYDTRDEGLHFANGYEQPLRRV